MCLSNQLPEEAEGGADQMATDEGTVLGTPADSPRAACFVITLRSSEMPLQGPLLPLV